MRRVLLWPMDNPLRLVASAVVAFGVVFALVHGHHAASHATAAPTPSPSAHTTTVPVQRAAAAKPTPTQTAVGPILHPHPLAVPPADAAAAVVFVKAWGSHKRADVWGRQLAPLVTPAEATLLSTVDPARVTSTRVTGPIRADVVGDNGSQLRVPTDGGPVELSLVHSGGRVLVEAVEPGR